MIRDGPGDPNRQSMRPCVIRQRGTFSTRAVDNYEMTSTMVAR